jgi:hypothetical protein
MFEQEISFVTWEGLNALITIESVAMITALQQVVCRAIKESVLQFKVTRFV